MFPLAFAINSFSMTILFMAFGFLGRPMLAADIAIVQGATLALFFAFSANARNLILSHGNNTVSTSSLLHSRIALVLPLGFASFILSTGFTQINTFLATILIIRRCAEWFSELHLSSLERNDRRCFAKVYIVVQSCLLPLAVLWKLYATKDFSDLGILLWAITPLIMDAKFISSRFNFRKNPFTLSRKLLPHFGSTATTGITVYIFRLCLIILFGKILAGDLLTAFAMGGLMSSVFNTAIGPSLALKKGQIRPLLNKLIKLFFLIYLMFGLLILLLSSKLPELLSLLGKKEVFWTALGSSMIGGSIMTLSLKIRIDLLQHKENKDVFGQDLVINLMVLTFTLFSYYIFGDVIGRYLFLINAIISFMVYGTSKWSIFSSEASRPAKFFLIGLIALLVVPIFFQLHGYNIFNEPIQNYSSQGNLLRVPIPVSVVICFCGILSIGNYEKSKASLYVIFFSFITMLAAILATRQDMPTFNPLDKIILMIQFILPMFGMVFGQMFFNTMGNIKLFAKASFFIISFIMITQLIATFFAKTAYLSAYLYFFTIYQHLQYVPTIFIALYLLALYALWEDTRFRKIHLVLSPFVGIYAMLSLSMATLFFLCAGLVAFFFINIHKGQGRIPMVLSSIVLLSMLGTHAIIKNTDTYLQKFDFVNSSLSKENEIEEFGSTLPDYAENPRSNAMKRVQIWGYYIKGVLNHPYTFVFGSPKRPDRLVYHSAHNYYLDIIYNFGVLALIPLAVLLCWTLLLIWRNLRAIMNSPDIFGLAFIAIFLIFGDNFVKVGLRQPYPGIITFFLLGVVLSRLCLYKGGMRASEL